MSLGYVHVHSGAPEDAVTMVKEQCGTFDGVLDLIASESTAQRILPLLNKVRF